MRIILLTPESASKNPHILHPMPGGYMISKEVETYRTYFSGTIEAIITEREWDDIMQMSYAEVPATLEKLAETIRMRSASHLSDEKLAA